MAWAPLAGFSIYNPYLLLGESHILEKIFLGLQENPINIAAMPEWGDIAFCRPSRRMYCFPFTVKKMHNALSVKVRNLSKTGMRLKNTPSILPRSFLNGNEYNM